MAVKAPTVPNTMNSDPVVGLELGQSLLSLSKTERKKMLADIRSGDVTELEFDAIVFRAEYPNANHLRFRDEDLQRLAESFTGQPFLRNHDTEDIASRDGTIVASRLNGNEIVQTVRVTSQRGMEDYLQGRIDRFSIGWYYSSIHCSICGSEWLDCNHWPGRTYQDEDGHRHVCELVFPNATGKETSAVNVPAVRGTRVLSADGEPLHVCNDVAHLCETKLQLQAKQAAQTWPPMNAGPSLQAPDPEPQPQPEEPSSTTPILEPEVAARKPDPPEPQPDPQVAPPAEEPAAPPTPDPEPEVAAEEPTPEPVPAPEPDPQPTPEVTSPQTLSLSSSLETNHMEHDQNPTEDVTTPVATPAAAAPAAPVVETPAADPAAPWLAALKEAAVTTMLQSSGLGAASQHAIRTMLGDVTDPERVKAAIAAQRAAEAALVDANVVRNINPAYNPAFGPMLDSTDKFKDAFYALLDGTRPTSGVKPLTGIREAYIHMSGDYEMTGKFYPDRVQLSNINTATMSQLMAEWLNMRIVTTFQSYDQFWRQYCRVENYGSLHDPHWLMMGGIGELSDVAEGATYTEKDWSVQTETTSWVKKGNWLGITMEAFDKDQTGYLKQAPQALAQAAYLSLGKSFTRMLVTTNGAGYGPTMRDSVPLYHATHNNLGSSALAQSSWETVRLAMARQTEQGSGEVLGGLCVPTSIMIPRHLENTALVMFASEGVLGSANNDINPSALDGATVDARKMAARRKIVINDFFGTDNSWYAFANPANYPLFGLGFRYGQEPEIYSVADERVGLMFTNDVLPIKIRFFYSMGPIDYRGVYKNAVA